MLQPLMAFITQYTCRCYYSDNEVSQSWRRKKKSELAGLAGFEPPTLGVASIYTDHWTVCEARSNSPLN